MLLFFLPNTLYPICFLLRYSVSGKPLIGYPSPNSFSLFHTATRDTIEMTNKMAEAGADAALVVTPCFYKNGMTSEALEKHFTKVY